MYKSAADISKDLDVSIKLAYPVYQQHEKIRQGKYYWNKYLKNVFLLVSSFLKKCINNSKT